MQEYDISGWQMENGKMVKEFAFGNFNEAVTFANKVAEAANALNHHPDILIHSYKVVKITLFTHAMGVITTADHQLAEKINAILI